MNFQFMGHFNPNELSTSLLSTSTIESVFELFAIRISRSPTNFMYVNLSIRLISEDELQTFIDKFNNRQNCRLSFQNDVILIMIFNINNNNESKPHMFSIDCNMRYGLYSDMKFDIDDNDFERMKVMFNSMMDYQIMINGYYDLLCEQEANEQQQDNLGNYITNQNQNYQD